MAPPPRAGLPDCGAMVGVCPPLMASSPSIGLDVLGEPLMEPPLVAAELMTMFGVVALTTDELLLLKA